jgi:hypothetical protein
MLQSVIKSGLLPNNVNIFWVTLQFEFTHSDLMWRGQQEGCKYCFLGCNVVFLITEILPSHKGAIPENGILHSQNCALYRVLGKSFSPCISKQHNLLSNICAPNLNATPNYLNFSFLDRLRLILGRNQYLSQNVQGSCFFTSSIF